MILDEITYFFSKRNLFMTVMISILVVIYFIPFDNNLHILIFSSLVIYLYVNRILKEKKEGFHKAEKIYKTLDFIKYKYIKNDGDMILCITNLEDLYKINKVEYRVLLNEINDFYRLNHEFKNSKYKKQIYDNSFYKSKNILNIINSYGVNINVEGTNIDKILLDKYFSEVQMILSKYLTNMEIEINKDWNKEEINVNSGPVYSGIENDYEVNQYNYNVY